MSSKIFSGDNREPLSPDEIAAADPMAKFAAAPTFGDGEKAIFPVTNIPAVTPPPTVEAAPEQPSVEMEESWKQDDDGQWEKALVPKGSVKVEFEKNDRFAPDPMGLGADWDEGRGKEFHARWANTSPQHRNNEAQARFAPVLAENVPHSIRSRYQISDKVPGFEGLKVLTFGDAVLMEKPKALFEAGYARQVQKRIEKTGGTGVVEGMDNRSTSSVGPVGADKVGAVDRSDPLRMMAEVTAEAEAIAYRQQQESGPQTFGGFQGNPAFNNTSWGQR